MRLNRDRICLPLFNTMQKEEAKTKIVFNWKNVALVLGFFVLLTGSSILLMYDNSTTSGSQQTTADKKELIKEDILVGKGEEAVNGKKVTVNYLGTLEDGAKFDSSYDRKQPFEFTLGEGSVIPGWELGVLGMKEGGKRKLTIPSDLGYGQAGSPPVIPPNATLVFEIELLKVE